MRRLPLVFVAMSLLHVYWTLCMIGYVIGPVAPCAAEFWIMSIIVPLGKQVEDTHTQNLMTSRDRDIPGGKHSIPTYCKSTKAVY